MRVADDVLNNIKVRDIMTPVTELVIMSILALEKMHTSHPLVTTFLVFKSVSTYLLIQQGKNDSQTPTTTSISITAGTDRSKTSRSYVDNIS